MSKSCSRRSRLRAAAVITVVAAMSLVGCGASTGAVKSDTKKSSTTAAAATTEAPTTSEAPDTTEESTTTDAPATTSGSSGEWPEAAKQKFLESCEGGDDSKTAICECALRAIEPQISVSQLFDAGSTGTLPDDVQKKITEAATECALDPSSH